MGWSEIREATRLAIAEALRLPDVDGVRVVEWENRNTAMRFVGGTFADLRFSGPVALGIDETRYYVDQYETQNVPSYGGPRVFGVQVLCQSESQEPDSDAVGVMGGRLRTRLRRDDVRAILEAGGVGLVRIGPTFDQTYTNQEGRAMSASSTDITFSCVEFDRDDEEDASWVENLEAEGTFTNGDDEIIVPVDIP